MARRNTAGASKGGVQNAIYTYAADAEASDAYAITLTPAPAAYAEGQSFAFKANTANTGASSLNVNGLGAKTLKKNHDMDTATGDIESGSIVEVVYDGTNFQIVSISALESVTTAAMRLEIYETGIIKEGEGVASLNADITKIDITAATYYIQGVYYTYAGVTGLAPSFGGGENSRYIGLDSSGLIEQSSAWSTAQKQTILPICRVNAVQGQTGSGSDMLDPLHQHYHIGETGFIDKTWHEHVIGVLYESGGVISESGTALQIDESAGVFHNAQREELTIAGSSDIEAIEFYHVAGVWTAGTKATLVCDNTQYDNGTDLTTMSNNKWVSHTLLKSPKDVDEFFLIYSQAEYASQADAEAANPDYGIFVSQAFSGVFAVASIVIQKSSANINSIVDRRPFIGGNVGAVLGTSNLQQTYDNSTSPEILTDATRGALSIKRGSAADTDDVLETLNGSGATKFSVTGEGKVVLAETLNEFKGSDIASATTTDIGAATGNFVDITGTTTITGLGTIQAGTRRTVQFDGILTLTHNGTSLILPTGANITTAAGDVAKFISLGSGNWICTNYTRADGSALSESVTPSNTATFTNKRITPRVTTEASSATPTINTDNTDLHSITALAVAITSMTTNLSGTPTNGQKLIIRFKDNATGRAITWGASFEAKGVDLPITTTASKVLTVGFLYDTVTSKWGCVASVEEA